MRLEELDKLDRKILYHLDKGGRLSWSELARTVRQGRDRVEYRVERLLEHGVIKGFRAMVNPAKLGLTLFKHYVRLVNDKDRIERLVERLKKERSVFWIVRCDGTWDLIFSVAAPSAFDAHSIQDKLLAPVSDMILDIRVYPVVTFWRYRLKYLHEQGTRWHEIGGAPSESELDDISRRLLLLLSQDARMSLAELAERLNSTPAVVQLRLARLEEQKTIAGYSTQLDYDVLGITQFKTQLYLQDFDATKERQLRDFCNRHPQISCYIWQLGDCRHEIESHVLTYAAYNEIIDSLRSQFTNLIRNFSTILMRDEYIRWGFLDG